MNSQRVGIRHRRIERFALNGLGMFLAIILSALGFGLLFTPPMAEILARGGHGPGFRMLLGASHLVGGIALLIPRIAQETAIVLGSFVASLVVYFHAEGEKMLTAGPALLAIILLFFGICLRVRHRIDRSAWHEMLGRYAALEDARRSKSA